jgi:hypothetical protein
MNLKVALILTLGYGVALLAAAVTAPAESFTALRGDIIACSTPFWAVGALAIVRMTVVELRSASQLKRQQRTQGTGLTGPAEPNGTER